MELHIRKEHKILGLFSEDHTEPVALNPFLRRVLKPKDQEQETGAIVEDVIKEASEEIIETPGADSVVDVSSILAAKTLPIEATEKRSDETDKEKLIDPKQLSTDTEMDEINE